jgi:uracil-DNA glycosylase
MADVSDDRAALRAELLTWVRQNQELGMEWFLDEGAPAEGPVSAPTIAPAPSSAVAPAANPAAPPAVQPASATTDGKDAEFQQSCESFVAETLELIRRHAAAPGSQSSDATSCETLEVIQAEVAACQSCSLHESRANTVFGAGDAAASLVFIGEAPGADEDRQGQPFVGKSGQLLGKIIEAIGFSRDDVFICNILKCRPPSNRDPQPDEVAACESYLKRQLAVIQPRVICCLGRVAAQTLLKTEAPLGKLRQSVHFYEGIPVMATYHPAALLRNPDYKRPTWEDVRKLRALHDSLPA